MVLESSDKMSTRNAKRIKNVLPTSQMMADLKPGRCDSFVYIHKDFDVTNLVKYVEKRKKGEDKITYFHAFMTAIAKVIYNRNKLNWFIQNRHFFEHNDVVLSFVAKVAFEDSSEELMLMIPIEKEDNVDSIRDSIKNKVEAIRKKGPSKGGANKAIEVLAKLPNIIRVPIMGLFKWMDDKGLLPSSLVQDNLYYSSMIVSNLGSIKCDGIHHNITNFGTSSSLATIGQIKNKEIINDDGTRKVIKVCDFGIAFDERVADGFYFIKSLELLQYIFDNPELLEHPASEKIEIKKN